MDLVPLIDAIGEPATALVGALMLGLVFGVAAQRSEFCTRSAVLDLTRGRAPVNLAVWLAGFAVALLVVQMLLAQRALVATETRFFGTPQSLSGALIGGLVFGVGMVLTRGCVSRLVVLAGTGNLRALFCLVVVAAMGLATFEGALVPLRNQLAGLLTTVSLGGNDLLLLTGLGHGIGIAAAVILAVAAIFVGRRSGVSAWRMLGGAVVGLAVAGGWYFTYELSLQVFDPIQVESLSYIRPLATTLDMASGGRAAGFDQGLVLGTLLGALAASVAFGAFRVATFWEPGTPSIARYTIGSALMGAGGILAVGCTVGAGLTGGSALAVASLTALVAMAAGAAVTDLLLDKPATAHEPARGAAE